MSQPDTLSTDLLATDLEALARAAAAAMWSTDSASQSLGMSLDAVGVGHATLSMTVQGSMCNGLRTCHGGLIFTLADSAFAFACNSHNLKTVAQFAQITFVAPAFEGERMRAEAREITRYGRSGIYDIRVTVPAPEGERLIAEFRGHSRNVKGLHIPEQPE